MVATTVDGEHAPAKAPEAAASPPKKSARLPLLILTGVAVVAGSVVGLRAWLTAGKESTDDAAVEADVTPIAPRIPGVILKMRAVDNQDVKKGDVLAEIDQVDYANKVAQAEADVAASKAELAKAKAQVEIVEAMSKGGLSSAKAAVSGSSVAVQSAADRVSAAKASLDHAKTDAEKAEVDLGRTKALARTGSIAQAALDDAQSKRDSAQQAVRVAEAQLRTAEDERRAASSKVEEAEGKLAQNAPIDAQVSSARAAADLAEAKLASSEVALAQAKIALGNTVVTAPSDGSISKLAVHEGQIVQAGQPLMQFVPAGAYIVANFKETQVGKMKAGDHAVVELDAFPGVDLDGKIESVAHATGSRFSVLPPENATGNFVKVVQRVPVRIALENVPANVRLRAGLSADVTVSVGK